MNLLAFCILTAAEPGIFFEWKSLQPSTVGIRIHCRQILRGSLNGTHFNFEGIKLDANVWYFSGMSRLNSALLGLPHRVMPPVVVNPFHGASKPESWRGLGIGMRVWST